MRLNANVVPAVGAHLLVNVVISNIPNRQLSLHPRGLGITATLLFSGFAYVTLIMINDCDIDRVYLHFQVSPH